MKEIIIISGKGGTGKTSVTAGFAALSENAVCADTDVDAADLHLLLNPDIKERRDFISGHGPVLQADKCTQCGICREMCRFDAVSGEFVFSDIACEGCGVCVHFCPEKAIDWVEKLRGELFFSETRFGPLVHARLGIAEENSGKLVALVRRTAREKAREGTRNLIITDGPPGIGCPVIAAIGGADLVLIVSEPTVSGRHDMDRVIDLARHFQIPALLCVNKYDLHPGLTSQIEAHAAAKGVESVGRIPFDPEVTRAMVQARTVLEAAPESPASRSIRELWAEVNRRFSLLYRPS